MNIETLSQLWAILTESSRTGVLWSLIASVPWIAVGTLRHFRGRSGTLYRTCLLAAGANACIWMAALLAIHSPGLAGPVDAWFLFFLYCYIPLWAGFWAMFAVSVFVYRAVTGEGDDTEEA